MIVDLTDTTGAAIATALVDARHRAGVPAIGMVMNFVIVTEESEYYDALRAALDAAREHPSRVLVVIRRPAARQPRLDAEIRFLGDSGPGETVVMRLHGELSQHAESVLLPLLLPDAPVVVWWPGRSPDVPALDPVGQLAQRRITDMAAEATGPDCSDMLERRARSYRPGDTDLAWTRITGWRSLLAAALDQPTQPPTAAEVSCEAGSPSAELLALWLEEALRVPVTRTVSDGPGLTGARLATGEGDIVVDRPDGLVATLSRPGQPPHGVSLPQRTTTEIIAEEMRRLDPDDIYGEVLAFWLSRRGEPAPSSV